MAEEYGSVHHNRITGGVFFHAVIQGRDITVHLPAPVPTALSGLPAVTSSFTGRKEELAILESLLDPSGRTPVSVLAGLAGVGKTELALQAAHAAVARRWFPGGVLWADLYGYDEERRLEPGVVLDGWLRALGIPAEHIPASMQDRARLYASVLASFAEQGCRLLVVVDNASSAGQVRPLLPTDGSTRVIVTSRDSLAMLDARLLDLGVLGLETASDLLGRVLEVACGDDHRVSRSPEEAARIARLCGCLPLALRIVAALLAEDSTLPLAEMASRLDDELSRLDEMTVGEVAVRAAFDLSYRQLSEEQSSMFRLVCADPGPDVSTAAAAVLADVDEPTARRVLDSLVRCHLLERAVVRGRWRFHDLVRIYSAEQSRACATSDGRDFAVRRLLGAYYLTFAQHASKAFASTGPVPGNRFTSRDDSVSWLNAERPNLLRLSSLAVSVGEWGAVLDLPVFLADYLRYRRDWPAWLRITEVGLAAARRQGDQWHEAQLSGNLSNVLMKLNRLDEAVQAARHAAELHRQVGDLYGQALALDCWGNALGMLGRYHEAAAAHQQSAQVARAAGDRYGEAAALSNLEIDRSHFPKRGQNSVGDFQPSSIETFEQAVAVSYEEQDWYSTQAQLRLLGQALVDKGQHEEATRVYLQGLQMARATGDLRAEGALGLSLGVLYGVMGCHDQAVIALQTAVSLLHESDDPATEARALGALGLAHRELGDLTQARACWEQGSALAESVGADEIVALLSQHIEQLSQERGQGPAKIVDIPPKVLETAAVMLRETADVYTASKQLTAAELRAHSRVGDALSMAGHADEAVKVYERVADLYGMKMGVDECLMERVKAGIARGREGRYDEAIGRIADAAFRLRVRHSPATDWARSALQTVYRRRISEAEADGDHRTAGSTYFALGVSYQKDHLYSPAIEAFQTAEGLLHLGNDKEGEARALGARGECHQKCGEFRQAWDCWIRGQALAKAVDASELIEKFDKSLAKLQKVTEN